MIFLLYQAGHKWFVIARSATTKESLCQMSNVNVGFYELLVQKTLEWYTRLYVIYKSNQ